MSNRPKQLRPTIIEIYNEKRAFAKRAGINKVSSVSNSIFKYRKRKRVVE